MPMRQFPFRPSRVNHLFLRGPRFHFDHISVDQLRSLGLSEDGPKIATATVRRLRDGHFNVIIESAHLAERDVKFVGFINRLNALAGEKPEGEVDSAFSETGSVGLDEL